MTTILDSLRPFLCLVAAVALFLGPTQRAYADYVEEVFADNPIGYWRFEETDGPAVDWTGNGRDGVYMNGVTPGLFPGVISIGGKSAAFDGTTGFVDLPGSWGGESMSELTLEAWVNPSEPITGNFQAIVAGHDPNAFAHFQLHTAGNMGVYSDAGFVAAPIVPATPTGEWRHVVMTASSGETKVYVDGAQVGGTVRTPFEYITESSNVDIGIGHVETRWFNGLLDEVAIYDTALSEERIIEHLLAGGGTVPVVEPPLPATLISHWTFDRDASDVVGGHEGTLEGGATLTSDAHVGDGALDLRGVDGYVDVPTAVLDGEESFSVAMFVNVDTLTHACCSALFTNDGWSSGKLHMNVLTATGVPEAAINGNPTSAWGRDAALATDGTWVHLAFTYDGGTGTMTPYVDGVAGNPGGGGTITSVGEGPMNIGAWDTTGDEEQDRFLDGLIDDLRVYSGVLTPEEVSPLAFPHVPLACDFDGNGACDVNDLDQLMYSGLGTEEAAYDLDKSGGVIDLADRNEWLNVAGNETIGQPYVLGDATLDGRVGAEDLNVLGISWQRTDATSWGQGDFDGNGRVDASDLNEIGVNWQHGVAAPQAAGVPEPGCAALVFVGWAVSCLRCRRRLRRS